MSLTGGDKQNIRYSRQHIYASRELQVGDRTLENNKYFQYTQWTPWIPTSIDGTGEFNLISNRSYFCVDNNIITYNFDFTVDVDTLTNTLVVINPVYLHTPSNISFRGIILTENSTTPGIQLAGTFIILNDNTIEQMLFAIQTASFLVGPEYRITGQASYSIDL